MELNFKEVQKCLIEDNKKYLDIEDFEISGISIDTRTMKKGEIFICIKGDKYDANDFIDIAIKKGVKAIITDKKVDLEGIPVIVVENVIESMQKLAEFYLKKMNVKVIAVTGSTGKTTTKNMIDIILSNKYKVFSTEKNYNSQIGTSLTIFNLDSSYDIAILELGMDKFRRN